MVRLYTAAEMREADRRAMAGGTSGLWLMENAGRAVAEVAARMAEEAQGPAEEAAGPATETAGVAGSAARPPAPVARPIVVLAGKGNNGGDGLVAARLLSEKGFPVRAVLAEGPSAFTGDALASLRRLEERGIPFQSFVADGAQAEGSVCGPAALGELIRHASVVVDALLGTGAKGAPREPVATIIRLLLAATGREAGGTVGGDARGAAGVAPGAAGVARRSIGPPSGSLAPSRPFVLAVDIPSGLDADTGRAGDPCVAADATVTLAGVKVGLVLPGASAFVGSLYLADIGMPHECLDPPEGAKRPSSSNLNWFTAEEAPGLLPARPAAGHKGTFGHVWVVAGSPGYSGAAVLAALGALRGGAGLVTAAVPAGIQPTVAASLPEAMTLGLPQGPDGRIEGRAAAGVLLAATRATGDSHAGVMRGAGDSRPGAAAPLVVGPGLGATVEVAEAVREIIASPVAASAARPGVPPVAAPSASPGPRLVVDADGLNSLALAGPDAAAAALRAAAGRAVVTPHPGEMSRLLGLAVTEVQADRVGTARRAAQAWGVVVVLKGAGTVVASPEGEVWINSTGNPGMATGGSGDVLSGVIGALLGQGLAPMPAALLGVYLHGLAGDIAACEVGSAGLLASDIAHRVPKAVARLRAAAEMPAGGEGARVGRPSNTPPNVVLLSAPGADEPLGRSRARR